MKNKNNLLSMTSTTATKVQFDVTPVDVFEEFSPLELLVKFKVAKNCVNSSTEGKASKNGISIVTVPVHLLISTVSSKILRSLSH